MSGQRPECGCMERQFDVSVGGREEYICELGMYTPPIRTWVTVFYSYHTKGVEQGIVIVISYCKMCRKG